MLIRYMLYFCCFAPTLFAPTLFAQHQLESNFDERVNELLIEMKVDTHPKTTKKTTKNTTKKTIKNTTKNTEGVVEQELDINCGLDDFEDNQTRSRSKNIDLSDREIQEIQLNAKICPFDFDWFSLYVEQGEIIQIQLISNQTSNQTSNQISNDLEFKKLEIFAPRSRKPMKNKGKKQEIQFFAHKPGRYKFLIQALWTQNIEISYLLLIKKLHRKH